MKEIEIYVGEYDDIKSDWHQSDLKELQSRLEAEGIEYKQYELMQKALIFDDVFIAGLAVWVTNRIFDVLVGWLPARQGRRVRIKFGDGTEMEAGTVKELEEMKQRFLPDESSKG